MHHACSSAEGPRTTSGAVQSNRTNGASATPLGPVWVCARYPLSLYIPSVDAPCVYECAEGPRTTSGPVQSNRTNGATATPLGPVWVYAHVEWVCYCLRYSLVPRQSSGRGERESAVAAAAADDTEQMHTSAPHATTMSAAARIFCSMPPEPPPERESERVWSWPKGQVWGASHVLLRLQAPAPPPVG
jgi:hypothetical protein